MHQSSAAPPPRRAVLLGLGAFLVIIPLLITVPYLVPSAPDVLSAATASGYNNGVASLVAVGWAIAVVLCFWATGRAWPSTQPAQGAPPAAAPVGRATWLRDGLILTLGAGILYCPFFLARYGPYVEDQVFLTALHRMHGGQLPFRDFEFLYGPLMIYPAWWWTKLFGYSMTAFYGYLAVLEVLLYLLLLGVVRAWVPDRRRQLVVFFLLAALLFNTLLAPNQNGLRKFLPFWALLLVAERPASLARVLAGGGLLGLQLAYSQDYGVAGLLGLLSMYGLLVLRGEGWKFAARGIMLGLVAALTWFAVTRLLTGASFGSYLGETLGLLQRFSAGEAGFRFYWTVNSLTLFALLTLGCALVGSALSRPVSLMSATGDRLLVATLVFALVGLKSGLNRCDLWHLDPAFLPLVAALLFDLPRRLVPQPAPARPLASVLVALLVVTYLAGQAPTGSYYLEGLVRGASDVLRGHRPEGSPVMPTRAPTINLERTHPNEDLLRMGEYFADSTRRERPVLFYGNEWGLGPYLGVYKTDHLNDSFIYSDARGHDLERFLAERPGAMIVMDRSVYLRLFGLSDSTAVTETRLYFQPTPMKSLASWLSSVHYRGAELEYQIRERRWKEGVGDYVRANFGLVAEFGRRVVLAREPVSGR